MKIVPTACKKIDAFFMHYPSKNIGINKNMHYSVLYHRVVAYKYSVLIADWSRTPMWELPSYMTYNHSVSVLR